MKDEIKKIVNKRFKTEFICGMIRTSRCEFLPPTFLKNNS